MRKESEEQTISGSSNATGGSLMYREEDVMAILELNKLGWGIKRIARELKISKNTIRKYLKAGGFVEFKQREKIGKLDGLESWLKAQFLKHGGNADVVRQELLKEHGQEVSLRTVERSVRGYREELEAMRKATVRFETGPGKQLQVDFGEKNVLINGQKTMVHLSVLTLGYSRRIHVSAHGCEKQAQWLGGIESAFHYFGGVPEELLVDNAKALVDRHDLKEGIVRFAPQFKAFCEYWGVKPKACAPYRPRTKGKDERGVGYVKSNALAGHSFESWTAMEGHLAWWMREIADVRIHGTTGEKPIDRFLLMEAKALRPVLPMQSYKMEREVRRIVQKDLCIELDTNHYSVPFRYIGRTVTVHVAGGLVQIRLDKELLASHAQVSGARQWSVEPSHLDGVVRRKSMQPNTFESKEEAKAQLHEPEMELYSLLRPLLEYEQFVGGNL